MAHADMSRDQNQRQR